MSDKETAPSEKQDGESDESNESGRSTKHLILFALAAIIGFVFLVAATVIGAAVVGAFVLDIDPAPPHAETTITQDGGDITVAVTALNDAESVRIEGGEFNGYTLDEAGDTHTAGHANESIIVVAIRGGEEFVIDQYHPA